MRFLADESTDGRVVRALRNAGYDVNYVSEDMRGASDSEVLARSNRDSRILITQDLDFSELIFRDKRSCFGLLQLRFEGVVPSAAWLKGLVEQLQSLELAGRVTTFQHYEVRVRSIM